MTFEKWQLEAHKCPKEPKYCRYCEAYISLDIFDEHVKMCSSRTEKCPLCGKYIKLIDYDVHVSTLACKNDPVPEAEPTRASEPRASPGRARRITAVAPTRLNR